MKTKIIIICKILTIVSIVFFASCKENVLPPDPEPITGTLEKFYAPEIVAVPPVNPYNCLFVDKTGEIRYYTDEGFSYSYDKGQTWKEKKFADSEISGITLNGRRPLRMNPKTKVYLRMTSGNGTKIRRSTTGVDGVYSNQTISEINVSSIRQAYFLPSDRAVIFTGQTPRPHQVAVFRSEDDGLTWTTQVLPLGPSFVIKPPHEGPRWENWCLEPTIVELNDGRLWILARTSQDEHWESYSNDAGKTWSDWQPSRFYGTLTMPTLLRLSDNRIVLFWSNSTPLPEVDRTNDPVSTRVKTGELEDVFTNRDVYHVAISEDDGKTWIGFRELRLNPWRNASNFGEMAVADFSVHQGEAIELEKDKILVAHGQNEKVRALLIFDTHWIYETRRQSSFQNNLDDWSTFKYIKGIVGHGAYNRTEGAKLINHPDKSGAQVLQFRHQLDPSLVFDKDGAVWNFPTAVDGIFKTKIQLLPGGGGAQICLVDRWFNPTDPVVADYSMYVLKIPGDGNLGNNIQLTPGKWYELIFDWTDTKSTSCTLLIDGNSTGLTLPLNRPSINGVSYVHFQSLSENEDLNGFIVESVEGGKRQ